MWERRLLLIVDLWRLAKDCMGQKISRDLLMLRIEFIVILLSILAFEGLILLLLFLLTVLVCGGLRLRLAFALFPLLILLLDELVLGLLGFLLALVPDPFKVAVYLLVSLGGLFGLPPDHLHRRLLLLVQSIEIRLTSQDLNCL